MIVFVVFVIEEKTNLIIVPEPERYGDQISNADILARNGLGATCGSVPV